MRSDKINYMRKNLLFVLLLAIYCSIANAQTQYQYIENLQKYWNYRYHLLGDPTIKDQYVSWVDDYRHKLGEPGLIGIGSAFSPNSRFLYVNATTQSYQFDLWASIDTVAFFDGAQNPFGCAFHTMQIAPDGKIYISCGNTEWVYHVIDRPDEKGDSCLFRQHAIELPSTVDGVPNFVNYRLGALTGSACDTLTGLNNTQQSEREKQIKVYPNPASSFVVVDYGFTNWNKGEVSLEIRNELGQIVFKQQLPMYSGFQKVDVSQFAFGAYNALIKRHEQIIGIAKFSKQ